MGPDMFDLLVEGRLGDRAVVDINDEAIVSANESEVKALFEFVPLATNHNAIAISIGLRAGDHWRDEIRSKTTDAFEQVANLLVLYLELEGIGKMLVLAAAAIPKMLTERLDAFR